MNSVNGLQSTLFARVFMALAFFALPLGFIGFELISLKQSLAEEVVVREQGVLLSSLRSLKDRRDLLGACRDCFNEGLKRAEIASSPRSVLVQILREAPHDLGLPMEFLFLDPDGRVDEELSDVKLPPDLAPYLARDLLELERAGGRKEATSAAFNARFSAYQDFFGPWFYRFGESKRIASILEVRLQEKRHFLYISPVSSLGRLLVFLDKPADWDIREIQRELSQRLSVIPAERGAILAADLDRKSLEMVLGTGFETGWRASLLMGSTSRQAMQVGDWLWAQVPIDQNCRIILGKPDASQNDLAWFRRWVFSVLFLVFFGAAVLFFRLSAALHGMPFRLSTRLFLLLIYVVGFPLLVYGLSARTLARDLDDVRQRQWHTRQVAILEELDQRFQDYLGMLEMSLKSRFRLSTSESEAEGELRTLLQETIQEFRPINGVYLDPSGAARFGSGETSFSLAPPIQKLFLKACSTVLGTQTKRKSSTEDDLAATLSEEYGFNAELVTSIISEHPERFQDLSFVSADKWFLLNPVLVGDGSTPFAVLTVWESTELWQSFLERYLPRFQAREPGILLSARSITGEPVHIPSNSLLFSSGEEVLQGFREARRPVTIPVSLGSTTWLLTGYRGSLLKGFLTMAGSPPDLRESAVTRFQTRMALIGIFLAVSGLLIARLLSAAFLGPIRELAQGVDALARRDLSYRIPPIGRDELGQLGFAFNQMLEDLKDLELARILQERIYPSGTAVLGNGWEIYGDCRSADEVGGDFFDYFRLPDGRWFLAIGDVSGHGTPSALIVAMAKGLFSHPRNPQDPGQILQDVQAVFGQVLPKRRMMMTCFVGLFTPSSGHLEFSNAGHNYPYLVQLNGQLKPLQTKGFPLGMGKKRRDGTDSVMMEPGSFLFLYTDGLIEAMDHEKTVIGYERVRDQLTSVQAVGAREGVESLRGWHDALVADDPQGDDITLMILKQRPGESG